MGGYNQYNSLNNRNAYSAYTPFSAYSAYNPYSAYSAYTPYSMHNTQFYGKVPKTAYNMRFKREAEAEPEAEPEAEAEAEADAAIMSPYSAYRPYSMQNNRFYPPCQNTNSFYGRNSFGGFGGYNQQRFGAYNQQRVYGNINGYNYGYGYNRYNQQQRPSSYYGYQG